LHTQENVPEGRFSRGTTFVLQALQPATFPALTALCRVFLIIQKTSSGAIFVIVCGAGSHPPPAFWNPGNEYSSLHRFLLLHYIEGLPLLQNKSPRSAQFRNFPPFSAN
jgi:hypothetical protein